MILSQAWLFRMFTFKSCKCYEAAFSLSTDQNCWDISSQSISNVIEMIQYYFLIKRVNNSVVNQAQNYHYKLNMSCKNTEML